MSFKAVFSVILVMLSVQFAGGGGRLVAADQYEADRRFVIGRISMKPSKKLPQLEAMNDYLARSLADGAQYKFDEIITPSVGQMAERLRKDAVDLISETPFAALELAERAGAEIILREWKNGFAEYSSILITRKDSGISSLKDLKGRVIVFEDPGSTSGFLLPLAILRAQGLDCVELSSVRDRPPANQIGYVFAHHEINVSTLVARGLADAGAMSDLDWGNENEVPVGFRQNLQVFYKSDPVLRSVVLVRRGLDAGLKDELVRLFEQMQNSAKGRRVMKKYNKAQKYDSLTGDLNKKLDALREMHRLVRDKIR